jgi:hypothetical protein
VPNRAPLSQPVASPPASLPNTSVAAPSLAFPQTGYSLDGTFLDYWEAHGGLPVFGMPIDSARQTDGQVAQWLERARFELHPENAAPYTVLLRRLGVAALQQQGRDWTTFATAAPGAPHSFAATGHAITTPAFWAYGSSHGLERVGRPGTSYAEALALFGYPISAARLARNVRGETVLTQWFERARFELHPSTPAADRVRLGRLGADVHRDT